MNMRRLSKDEIENLKIGQLVNVKILYCVENFSDGISNIEIKERYQFCEVVKREGNCLHLKMNDKILVVDVENCNLYR